MVVVPHYMKLLLYVLIFLTFTLAYADDRVIGDSLEDEFTEYSETKLPLSYSTINGLSFDYFSQKDDSDENDDNLFNDLTGLSVNLGPTGIASIEKIKRLVNLEEANPALTTIQESKNDSSYLFIENLKWDLGVGIEAYDYTIPGTIVGGFSTSLLRGKNYYSVRTLHSKSEIRKKLKMPLKLENLSDWRVGDQIFYATRGGVVTNMFLGFRPFFSIGPEYVHLGSYRIKAHLIAPKKLQIEFTTTSTDSISFEYSSTPISFDLTRGFSHIKSMLYEFDLTSPEAVSGIIDLFHGRLDRTHEKMLNLNGEIKLQTDIHQHSLNFSGKYGIPIVYINGSSLGTSHHEGKIEIIEENIKKEFDVFSYSSIKESYSKGFISDKKWNNETIATTILRGTNTPISVIGSIYSWSFSKQDMKVKNLKKKFSKLSKVLRKPKLNELQFPNKKLGYLKAEILLEFSGGDLLFLTNKENLNSLKKHSFSLLESDFNQFGHKAFCYIKTRSQCLNLYVENINSKIDLLNQYLFEIKSNYQENNLNYVTQKLTKMISALLSSRYLTQSYISKRSALKIELLLEGENIKKHRIIL